jgi:hypothetical protein
MVVRYGQKIIVLLEIKELPLHLLCQQTNKEKQISDDHDESRRILVVDDELDITFTLSIC